MANKLILLIATLFPIVAQAQTFPTLQSLTGNEYWRLGYPPSNAPLYATTDQVKTYVAGAVKPWVQGGKLIGADFNSTADQAITITSPTTNYTVFRIFVTNSSCDMSSATVPTGGFYTAASKGGVQIVPSSQSYAGLTATAVNTLANFLTLSSTNSATLWLDKTTIYFSLSTAHGSACTADIYVETIPLY